MKREPTFPPPQGLDVYNEDGVDLTLIREMLAKKPEERLQIMQDLANSLLMMRHELAKP